MSVIETLSEEIRNFRCDDCGMDGIDIENVFLEVQVVANLGIAFVNREDKDKWDHVCECDACWANFQETMWVLAVDVETQDKVIELHQKTRRGLEDDKAQLAEVHFDPFATRPPTSD